MKILLLFGLLAVAFGKRSSYYSYQPEDIREGFIEANLQQDGMLTRYDLLEIMRKIDVNGDGFLSYVEYKLPQASNFPRRILKGQFQYLDKLDGEIDGRTSFMAADRMINILDTNRDGVVKVDEFLQNIPHVLDQMTKEIDALAE
ncbi:hypothetical protein C0Q70_12991 [Pomacea canaliculata]|uniref:EF-hand domain-containing protein n=1 Tax=Pomacea canaliculata TaxID=400727 RepID=A0A2T7P311_POMCA|nr:hypothetical protein C0Q70_12991 [Pomacea canaliculata]